MQKPSGLMVSPTNMIIPVKPEDYLLFQDRDVTVYLDKELVIDGLEFLVKDVGNYVVRISEGNIVIM